MDAVSLIIKKREGNILTTSEIARFVQGSCDKSWPDYQISAMLMAMFIRGLNPRETTDLTLAMAGSGDQLDLSGIAGIKVDKHSTGGVADTTSLIVVPLVSACGVPVVKLSGRGLGFTGGTIDKLESIPGFEVSFPIERALKLIGKNHAVIMSQSLNLTPADQKLYALRDVTGTVDSIPLIAASIMSKKIAAGADAIVLDVKCGSGAFMPDLQSASHLAETMVEIGKQAGRKVRAVINGMDQPLGSHVGNALEVIEAIEVLKGHVRGPLLDVSLQLGAQMLEMAGHCTDITQGIKQLDDMLESGAGLAQFRHLVAGQGGDIKVIADYGRFRSRDARLTSGLTGQVGWNRLMLRLSGMLFVKAGGGRLAKGDTIDYSAGFILDKRLGDRIERGERLARIQALDESKAEDARDSLMKALVIGEGPPEQTPVILKII